MAIVAQSGNVTATSLTVKRPKWDDVYAGYPKNESGTDDRNTEEVFISILGEDVYNKHKNIFTNACATRVSLGLLNSGMSVKPEFRIYKGIHKGKMFTASAINLKDWLSKESNWGSADIFIKSPTSLSQVQSKIGKKDGVYFIIGGFGGSVSGHATLWIGAIQNVIGGHHYIGGVGDVYFWELK